MDFKTFAFRSRKGESKMDLPLMKLVVKVKRIGGDTVAVQDLV